MKRLIAALAIAFTGMVALAPAANATFSPPDFTPPPGICDIIPSFPGCPPVNQGGTAVVDAEVDGTVVVATSTKDISHVTIAVCVEGSIEFIKHDDLDGKEFEVDVEAGVVVAVFVKSGQNTTTVAEELLVALGGVLNGQSTGDIAYYDEDAKNNCVPDEEPVLVLVCVEGVVTLVPEAVAVEEELEILTDVEVGDTVPCEEPPTTTTTEPPTTTTTQPPTTTTTEPPVTTTTTTEPPVVTPEPPAPDTPVVSPPATDTPPPAEVPVTNVSNDDELAFGGSWSAIMAMVGLGLGALGLTFRLISRRLGSAS